MFPFPFPACCHHSPSSARHQLEPKAKSNPTMPKTTLLLHSKDDLRRYVHVCLTLHVLLFSYFFFTSQVKINPILSSSSALPSSGSEVKLGLSSSSSLASSSAASSSSLAPTDSSTLSTGFEDEGEDEDEDYEPEENHGDDIKDFFSSSSSDTSVRLCVNVRMLSCR